MVSTGSLGKSSRIFLRFRFCLLNLPTGRQVSCLIHATAHTQKRSITILAQEKKDSLEMVQLLKEDYHTMQTHDINKQRRYVLSYFTQRVSLIEKEKSNWIKPEQNEIKYYLNKNVILHSTYFLHNSSSYNFIF